MAVRFDGPWGLTGLARVDLVFSLMTMFLVAVLVLMSALAPILLGIS